MANSKRRRALRSGVCREVRGTPGIRDSRFAIRGCRKAAPCLAVGSGPGVWRCLSRTLPAHPCHRAERWPLRVGYLLPGEAPDSGLRRRSGTNCRLAPLRAAGPFGAGGFPAGLPCGASQPVPPCHRAPVARRWPRWRWRRIRGRDPEPLRLRRFRAGKPFPACGVVSTTPPPTPRNVPAAERGSKPVMTRGGRGSRSLEDRAHLSSRGVSGGDRTAAAGGIGLCGQFGKGGWWAGATEGECDGGWS